MCEEKIKVKDSVLWEYAEKEFKRLPIDKKIKLLANILYPERDNTNMTLEQKIDVIIKSPDPISIVQEFASPIEQHIIELLSRGYTYREVCQKTGLSSRSSIRKIIRSFGKRIMEEL